MNTYMTSIHNYTDGDMTTIGLHMTLSLLYICVRTIRLHLSMALLKTEQSVGVRSTVVERATYMRVYAGSSPTSADHPMELI